MATGFIGNQNSVRSYSEYFSGNDATLAFQMGQAGYNMNGAVSLRVNIYGVAQPPSSFAVSGKTLTFFTAPPTGTSNIEVVHMVPYLNEMNPLQLFTFVDSMTSLNVVTLAGTSETFTRSNTSSLNATSAYIQSLDAVNFRGAIVASNYATFQAAVAAATTNANTLIVTSNVVMSATTTVPSTVPLVFTSNGRVTLQTGFNLWIQGSITADPITRLFIGSGTANGFGAVEEIYPEWWGAVRNGVTDDTIAFTAAMAACANGTLDLLSGSYLLNVATYSRDSSTIKIHGQGDSTILLLPNTNIFNGNVITFSGNNIIATIDSLTVDQQSQIQLSASDNEGIQFKVKGSTTNTAGLIVTNCTFRNGCQADIDVNRGDSVQNTSTFVQIIGNRFLGGSEGTTLTHDPRSINISTPCDYIIQGNYFDLMRDRTAYGRAGIVCFDGWGVITNTAPDFTPKGVVTGNYLRRMGRSQTGSTLGCIDAYNFGIDLLIDGNVILDCFGRGIQTKADARRVIISNNLVDGLANGIGALLAINSSPDYTAGGTILIDGNILANNPFGDGMVVTGFGVQESTGTVSQSRQQSVLVTNNIIKNLIGNGINQTGHQDVAIHGNLVSNALYGIATANTVGSITIRDNQVNNVTAYGIHVDSSCDNAAISITNNFVQDLPTRNFRGISVASGRSLQLNGNQVQNVNGAGIVTTVIRNACSIMENMIDGCLTHGITVADCNVLDVNHNVTSNTGNIGIYCQGGMYQSTASIGLRGNRINNTTDEGGRADNFQYILWEGNIVANAGVGTVSTGLYSQQVGQGISFIGNQILSAAGVGISVGSANTGVKIIHHGNWTNNTVNYGILNNAGNVSVSIMGNQIANVTGSSRGIYVTGNVSGQIVGNYVEAATVTTPLFEAFADGFHSIGLNSWNATQGYGTAAPVSGIWKKNDIIWATNVVASGNIGFVCTVAGSPGTWKNFGAIGA